MAHHLIAGTAQGLRDIGVAGMVQTVPGEMVEVVEVRTAPDGTAVEVVRLHVLVDAGTADNQELGVEADMRTLP